MLAPRPDGEWQGRTSEGGYEMKRFLIALGAIVPMLFAVTLTPHSTAANEPVEVSLKDCLPVGIEAVPAGTPVTVKVGWGAKTRGLVQDALNATDFTLSVNGEPLPNANNLWSPPSRYSGGWAWVTWWSVTLDPLAPGESYTLQWTWRLSHPVVDGYDYGLNIGLDRVGPNVTVGTCTVTAS